MRFLLRNLPIAAGTLTLSFVLVGCESSTPAPPPAPAPAEKGAMEGPAPKGAMEGPAAKPPEAEAPKTDAATPPAEKKDEMPPK